MSTQTRSIDHKSSRPFSRRAALSDAVRDRSALDLAVMVDELARYPPSREASAAFQARGGLADGLLEALDRSLAAKRERTPRLPRSATTASKERATIYKALKRLSPETREFYFSAFGYGALDEKKRKRRVAKDVFRALEHAKPSSRLVLAIDPTTRHLGTDLKRDRVYKSAAALAAAAFAALARPGPGPERRRASRDAP